MGALSLSLSCGHAFDCSFYDYRLPHPVIQFVCYNKGKKVIPRVFRFLRADQILEWLAVFLAFADMSEIFSLKSPVAKDDVCFFLSNIGSFNKLTRRSSSRRLRPMSSLPL